MQADAAQRMAAERLARGDAGRLRGLLDQIRREHQLAWDTKEIRDKVDVSLIGPANSTGLQNMVREVRWNLDCISARMQNALRGISIISPRATWMPSQAARACQRNAESRVAIST